MDRRTLAMQYFPDRDPVEAVRSLRRMIANCPPAGCRPRCTGRTLEKETAHGTSGTSHQGLSGRSVATPPTDCPVQLATDCPVQLATDYPVQFATDCPVQFTTDYPVQFTTDCPVQLATDSPDQLATDSPDQFSDGLSRPDGL